MLRLEHVGIATAEAKRTADLIRRLTGVVPYKEELLQNDSVRTVFIDAGGSKLELLEPLNEGSPVARFLLKRGEGLHHLAFEVRDIDEVMARLQEDGFTPLDPAPRRGADGKRIFFLHPKDTGGILIEFCESSRPLVHLVHAGEGGRSIQFLQGGSGANPPLLLFGLRSRTEKFGPILQRLERRYHIIAPIKAATATGESSAVRVPPIGEEGEARCLVYSEALEDYFAALERGEIHPVRGVIIIEGSHSFRTPQSLPGPHLLLAAHDDAPDLSALLEAERNVADMRMAVIPGGVDSEIGASVIEHFLG